MQQAAAAAARRVRAIEEHLSVGEQPGAVAQAAGKKKWLAPLRVHLICGDIMIVTNKMAFDHDVQYANRKFLEWMDEYQGRKLVATVASDYSNLDKWLKHAHVLISYCSGPVADDANTAVLQKWLEEGGKMIGVHGTSGGFARRVNEKDLKDSIYPAKTYHAGNNPRKYVKKSFHDTLGAFFMAHPPVHTYPIQVADWRHPIMTGIPAEFTVADELYLFELQGDLKDYQILLTTEYDILGVDMERSNYAYRKGYPWDPSRNIKQLHQLYEKNAPPAESEMCLDRDPGARNSAHPQIGSRNKRVLAYERKVGKGAIFYTGMGHTTVNVPGRPGFKGVWENPIFEQVMRNAIAWAAAE